MKNIVILGITGSIGSQTVEVVKNNSNEFNIIGFSVGYDSEYQKTCELIEFFNPKMVSCIEESTFLKLVSKYPNIKFVYGENGLVDLMDLDCDVVVNSVVGSVGLKPTIAAIRSGKTVALANKETLVIAGELIMAEARKYNVNIFPIDSEHSAIFQCLNGENQREIKKLIITASGGSFRDLTRDQLTNVSIEDTLNHPNWSMGPKITVDSATMMNKGLEIIEAHHLFNVDYDNIEAVIHYESTIHSMVEFCDNSIIAQLGTSDMTLPIAYALSYPKRLHSNKSSLDLVKLGSLNFKKLDFDRYPCVKFAYDAGRVGHTLPAVMNASNEIAVAAFLNNEITFLQIEEIIEQMMNSHTVLKNPTLDDIILIDKETRVKTMELIKCL